MRRAWVWILCAISAAVVPLYMRAAAMNTPNPEMLLARVLRDQPGRGFDYISQDGLCALVQSNYTPLVEGVDVIAGREVWTLRLKPHDKYRPWKQIWIDKQTYAVLAQRNWSSYNRLKSATKTKASFLPTERMRPRSVNVLPQSAAVRLLPKSLYMASGYRLAGAVVINNHNATQLTYTDGLHAINIFICKSRSQTPSRRLGFIEDFGQGLMITVKCSSGYATVLADLPVEEIEKIASSLQ